MNGISPLQKITDTERVAALIPMIKILKFCQHELEFFKQLPRQLEVYALLVFLLQVIEEQAHWGEEQYHGKQIYRMPGADSSGRTKM
jgi:hypothetical protein